MSTIAKPISPLRQRMIEDMCLRKLGEKTQSGYIRGVKNFSGISHLAFHRVKLLRWSGRMDPVKQPLLNCCAGCMIRIPGASASTESI